MKAVTVKDLPPVEGKTGWPWTEGTYPADRLPPGMEWPRFTIVTPSYNQADYLEETIRSVLLQGYRNLEYFVIDGGSTDCSVEVVRRYEPWLAGWVSEKDEGQSHAINKGFERATGEVYGWLNSDDVYEPGALQAVGRYLLATPDCSMVYGDGWHVDEAGQKTEPADWIRPFDRRLYLTSNFILQPAAFWRAWLWKETGGLDVDCHWTMDWEWFLRATALATPHYLPVSLARWRMRPEIKTLSGGAARRREIAAISRRHGGLWQPTHFVYQLDRAAWQLEGRLGGRPVGRLIQKLVAPFRHLIKEKLWYRRYQS